MRLYFPKLESWVARSTSLPAVPPVYLWANVVLQGATHHSACPTLHHSESGPLGLSARMWGHRVCRWSDHLPLLSHTPPVWVPPRQCKSSPPWLPVSAPPTSLDECFFFISLVVGFLYSSIFCQFWLFTYSSLSIILSSSIQAVTKHITSFFLSAV